MAQAAAERVQDLLDTEPAIRDSSEVLELMRLARITNADAMPGDDGGDKEIRTIEFRDVDFSYVDDETVLTGFSMSIKAGDTIKFVSTNPYRIVVSGRINHFTSAFGEHVIAEEVENALQKTIKKYPAQVIEFHVAPQINPESGLPFHEWFIEFEKQPNDLLRFTKELDVNLQNMNPYYKDLISGKVLRPLMVSIIEKSVFRKYMASIGKLGGQNKVPRLSNDRKIANQLKCFE